MPFIVPIFLAAFLILGFSPQALPAQAKPDFSNYEYQMTEEGVTIFNCFFYSTF